MRQYHELRIPGRFDPMAAVVRLAGSGLFEDHVVYEREGRWWLAGDRLAEVVADARSLRAGGDRPLEAVRARLADAGVAGWNAFGWAAFELAYALAGRPAPDGPLLHLFIPRTEVRLSTDAVLIRSVDEERLAQVRELVCAPALEVPDEATPVDTGHEAGRDAYQAAVAKAVADIRAGLLGKVILSRAVDVPFEVDLPSTYLRGRRNNTPARSFLLDLGGRQAAGFSPETVAEVTADGHVCTQPLAGTRAFTGGGAADDARRQELVTDPKEVFEHAASVKLACDELAGICEPGSVAVSEFMAVKERGSVQHLGSRVGGRLAEGRSAFDAFAALFPAITASGIPKAPAYDRITALEDTPRDLYAGAVLMASDDGALDAALVLRAIYRSGERAWLRAGAGVVADSTPEREYEETCEKLGSVAPHVVRRVREKAAV
ncbi:salicylate synthase [Nocardiopsis aegyptia]|uniref:salicylate synthase n=1 Tax=Nocardiopsis aegyptia TaxID=220378 RepID=UPI003672D014